MKLTDKQKEILNLFAYDKPIDLLRHYPLRYETLFEKPMETWVLGELVIFKAALISGFKTFRFGKNQSRTTFEVLLDDYPITITLFNRPYLKQAHYTQNMVIIGTVQENGSILARSITNKPIETQTGIIPIYPLKQGVKQHEMRRLIKKVIQGVELPNQIPNRFIQQYRLMSRKEALNEIHFPTSNENKDAALRTLKYEEFLIFHLVNALDAKDYSMGIKKEINFDTLKTSIKTLPFSLTADQILALEEINADLQSTRQMHRLLQGDVGSGKTIVALLSSLSLIEQGYQVAFMVPTEILLEQHILSVKRFFPHLKMDVLSSSTKDKDRILKRIQTNETQLILGTHALFQKEVEFNHLGMVIIDEQHRFGVGQRQALIQKGNKVDVLMLSATPIPRSLASSIYFDLDVSTIQTYPKSKQENKTIYVKENSLRSIMDELHQRLEEKDQMYVVCASIEEAKAKGYRNVLDIYEALKVPFSAYRIAYIHGKMKSEEKEKVMSDFAQHKYDILVSTTIIEVGIDIHNANTMVIYNAEMFGLSTLHQLRGRIGRGTKAGVCYVLSSHESEEVTTRLNSFVSTNDGFALSLQDLRLRGMGDLLGERQSGLPNFILGDITQDQKILNQAKKDAKWIAQHTHETDNLSIVKISSELKMMYN